MREPPPQALIELLERLGLATAAQVRAMRRRVRRLARDLPLLESVWVDALAQARILTPLQANQINAGRGQTLAVGPYVLCRALGCPGYAAFYRARPRESGEAVRLAVIDPLAGDAERITDGLEALAAASIEAECLAPVRASGVDGDRGWAAGDHFEGKTAAEWMVHNGRFPPEVVLEIARQMLPGLVALEEAGLCHGDIGAAGLVLTGDGRVVLPQPGLRAVVRPEEGYAHADLLPEAYDYLAPERITDGGPPTVASELNACGCLWWHLLTGRAPVPGASSLAKLRAAQTVRISEVGRLAPDTPSSLAAVVSSCIQRSPGRRPESMAQVAARLGPSTHAGRLAVARCLTCPGRRPGHYWAVSLRTIKQSNQTPLWLAVIAGCLVGAVALGWSIWNARMPVPTASIPAQLPRSKGFAGVAHPKTAVRDGQVEVTATPTPAEAKGVGSVFPPDLYTTDESLPEKDSRPPGVADLVLPGGRALKIESLELRPGQCVRGEGPGRALIVVPRNGLPVAAENVRFENIDFVWGHERRDNGSGSGPAAMIELRAGQVDFHRCSFQASGSASGRPVAVRWTHPPQGAQSELALPSGRVQMSHCVLSGVEAGIECRTVGARAVRLVHVLHLGPGPMVRLDHCPRPDEPVVISLAHSTLRGAAGVVECRYGQIEGRSGRIAIEAGQCAFVPGEQGALLVLAGPEPPTSLLAAIQWTGQGSLLAPQAPVAVWHDAAGRSEVLDDASLSMAGLVRSEVQFAGSAEAGPAASRITRWQGPLRSTDAPGVDPARLTLPEL